MCEGARLEQEIVPARLRCAACAHEWEIEDAARSAARRAAAATVEVVTGEELEVESIEVEEEAACIA